MSATPRHVIFGTGAIGLATLDALRRRGEDVRLVNRSGTALVPDDVEGHCCMWPKGGAGE
jgi:nucleoside-diphosphate-sugar epimerase